MQTLMPYAVVLAQAVGWSLLHSLWQGALIYLLLFAIFRAFPAIGATLRHGCSVMALLLLALWTAYTAIAQWQLLDKVIVHITPGSTAATEYVIEVPRVTQGYNNTMGFALPQLNALMPWITLCYGIGLLAMMLRLGNGLGKLRSLRRHGTTMPDGRLVEMLHSLQLQVGIAQRVALRLSARAAVPMVIGVLRPLILLPATMVEELDAEGLEAILLHELAHICRADFLINLFQAVVETLLFFNPFVWLISGAIHREREHCCDDLVVRHTRQPLAYARALASLAGRAASPIALAATGQQHHLLNRIKRIIEMKNHPLRNGQIIAACSLAAILIAVSIVCFTPTFAQHANKGKKTQNSSQSAVGNSQSTTTPDTRIIIVDSNGTRHEYSNMDQVPAHVRAGLERDLKKGDEEMEAAGEQMKEAMSNLAVLNTDSISDVVNRSLQEAFDEKGLSTTIRHQVDSAMHEVASIDWSAIQQEISSGMAEAEKAMNDPKIREEWKKGMEMGRKEMAMAMRNQKKYMEDSRHTMEDARRNMEQAREEMARAREEMQRAKEEMSRLKHSDK